MGCKVIEIPPSCNVTLHTPGQLCTIIVQIAWRYSETYLHTNDPTYLFRLHDFFHLEEIWQVTAVVCHETGHARFLRYSAHAQTFFIRCCQRLLHIGWLTRFHSHDGIGGVGGRRRSDVHSIDFRIVQQRLCINVPLGDVMAFSIAFSARSISAHDRDNRGARH